MRRLGTTFEGTDSKKQSVANEEILPKRAQYYKFSLMVDQDCVVSINDSKPILIGGGIGFSTNQSDAVVNSFKFLEDGVTYFWIGGN